MKTKKGTLFYLQKLKKCFVIIRCDEKNNKTNPYSISAVLYSRDGRWKRDVWFSHLKCINSNRFFFVFLVMGHTRHTFVILCSVYSLNLINIYVKQKYILFELAVILFVCLFAKVRGVKSFYFSFIIFFVTNFVE